MGKNKFWQNLKRITTCLLLVVMCSSTLLLTGCFDYSEDGPSLNDVLHGVRLTYQKSTYENGQYVATPDETFIKELRQQYLDLSVEILLSLASEYGRGIEDLSVVLSNISTTFGEVSLEDIRYTTNLSADDNYYNTITNTESAWAWSNTFEADELLGKDAYASRFCNDENLFRMQVALYLINMGVDCSGVNYGGQSKYFTLSQTAKSLDELALNSNITHSGIIKEEQELLANFILNNIIANNQGAYKSKIKEIVEEILIQEVETTKDGITILKYQIVASVMVKDYYISEIALDSSDSNNVENLEDEENQKSEDFFTMNLGQQFYKSLIFMPKKLFVFNEVMLIFQSTEDVVLTVYARIHEANNDEYVLNEKVAELQIKGGDYNDLSSEDATNSEFSFSITEYLEETAGIVGDYYINEYNKKTDVPCYGGILGTGLGDSLFDKFGRALKINGDEDDAKLASLYKVSKEYSDTIKNSVGLINFEKEDSAYLELVFETDVNVPFNIGFFMFDYEDPDADKNL